ncbi:hypothetical protein Gotri_012776, partial [Gossypium trilobum]|nr:hypothetical protein [Gossypium trilobum]
REANTQDGVADVPVKVILSLDRPRSWKDNFIGTGLRAYDKTKISTKVDGDDLDLLDEDIMRLSVNSIPVIDLYYQPYSNMVMAWIRLPGLPGHLYKRKIFWEIGGMIGRVAKLDFNIDNRVRGRFARMAVYVNLGKALISQVLINGVLQKAEYEYLPTVTNGASKEKTQENIRFQPLESLSDEMGPQESRPMKENNLAQKELGFALEQKTATRGPSPTGQTQQRPVSSSATLQPEVELVTGVTMARAQAVTQGRQIVAISDSNGVLNPTKHSVVVFKDFSSIGENQEEHLALKNTKGNRMNASPTATKGKLNGNTKGQNSKELLGIKGAPSKLHLLKSH